MSKSSIPSGIRPAARILAEKILPAVGRECCDQAKITGFLAMRGSRYHGELMIVGRAVNGWACGIEPAQLKELSACQAYANDVIKSVTGTDGKCPMSWVTSCWGPNPDYNTKKSAFWRVTKRIVDGLNIAETENDTQWPSHLVWSNLYKVAPAGGGNPNSSLSNAQLEGCARLLTLEIEQYRPQRLLFMTGSDWVSGFIDDERWLDKKEIGKGNFVETIGVLTYGANIAKCVIACHPARKKEDIFVEQVVSAFNEGT